MEHTKFDFIELIYEYPLYLPIPEKEDYSLLPISIANEMGLKTAIFTSRTKLFPQKKEVFNGINVFRFDSPVNMLSQVIRAQPALVHGHSFGWIPANIAPVLVKKYVLTPHIYKLSEYPKWKIDLAMSLVKRSDALITLTHFEASQFKNTIAESKINVIPHPIDVDFFSRRRKNCQNPTIQKYGSAEKVILCVSNLFPRKNLETLIRSFALIKKTFPKAKLLIVGGEPKTKLGMLTATKTNWNYLSDLDGLLSSKGVKEDVIFIGYKRQNDLRDFYGIADVFCLPSLKEGQSLAAGEAAASGLPLVLSELEPLVEIYHGCALFHKPLDHEKLSTNVINILQNTRLSRTLGNMGRSKMKEYCPSKIGVELKKLYSLLLR